MSRHLKSAGFPSSLSLIGVDLGQGVVLRARKGKKYLHTHEHYKGELQIFAKTVLRDVVPLL